MLITIDPYYDINFYNQCKQALKNNNVKFTEFVNIKQPYNWVFEVQEKPIMINYDEVSSKKFLIPLVKPLRSNEQYLLYRRIDSQSKNGLLKYIENEPLKEARLSDYACFFNLKSVQEGERISKQYPGKIWYLGRYFGGRYRICLVSNNAIKAFVSQDRILLEKNPKADVGEFEQQLNYKVLLLKEQLNKYTETPYFLNGQYIRPKIENDEMSSTI